MSERNAEDLEFAPVLSVLNALELASLSELMIKMGLKHKPTFRHRYLLPAVEAGYIEMRYPHSPTHPKQQYFLSTFGKARIK